MRISSLINVQEGMKGQWLLATQIKTIKNSMLEIVKQTFDNCPMILRKWVHELSKFIHYEIDI